MRKDIGTGVVVLKCRREYYSHTSNEGVGKSDPTQTQNETRGLMLLSLPHGQSLDPERERWDVSRYS